MSKEDLENPQYSFTKKLRSWFGTFVREYQHTKTRQNTAVISGTLTTNQPQITQFVPAQANAASVVQQSRPLADTTNVQRGQDEGSNGYGKGKGNNRRRKFNNNPADNRTQQVSIIKHSGASVGFDLGDRRGHGVHCAVVMTTRPMHYPASGESGPRAAADNSPLQCHATGGAGLGTTADNIPEMRGTSDDADEMFDALLERIKRNRELRFAVRDGMAPQYSTNT